MESKELDIYRERNLSDEEDTIDLAALIQYLLKHVWAIILCAVVFAAASFFFTKVFITPQYNSTAKLYIVSSQNNVISLSDLQLGTNLTKDYSELVLSIPVLETVISNLRLDMTYQQLSKLITISNPKDTRVLYLTVQYPDPVMAMKIANEFVEVTKVQIPAIMRAEEPTVVQYAVLQPIPISPSKAKNTLLGGFLGGALMAGIFTVLFLMDTSIKNDEDLKRYTGLDVLALVPVFGDSKAIEKEEQKRRKSEKNQNKKALSRNSEHHQTAPEVLTELPDMTIDLSAALAMGNNYMQREAFNTLYTNVGFSGIDMKKIMLTSCFPNEGKSYVSFELMRRFAEDGKKVILIDTDLRNSALDARFSLPTNVKIAGLTHYLTGHATFNQILYKTTIPNAFVIMAGRTIPNPVKLLGSTIFQNMIHELSEVFDAVIIDTAPLETVIDAAIVSKVCDSAIVVIEANATSYKAVQDLQKQLRTADCPIMGAVLNKVEMKQSSYYNKYYGKKYGYGYYQK